MCRILLRTALASSKYVLKYIPTKPMQHHKAKPEKNRFLTSIYTKICKNLVEISENI
jgi:hypothetical protein